MNIFYRPIKNTKNIWYVCESDPLPSTETCAWSTREAERRRITGAQGFKTSNSIARLSQKTKTKSQSQTRFHLENLTSSTQQ